MKKLFIFMLVAGIVVSNLDAAVEWTKTGTKQQKVGMVWSNNTKAQKQKLYNEYHANKGKFVGGIVGGGVDKRPSGNSWWVQRYQPVSSPVWSPGANIARSEERRVGKECRSRW